MDRRTIVSLSLGLLSVACAVGAFEPGPPQLVVEPLADDGGHGVVQGIIRDATTGETIKDALVILQCSCLQGPREVVSNADGVYNFRHLPPGKYTVQVLFGQANVNRSFDMAAGVRVRADFRVEPEHKFIIT